VTSLGPFSSAVGDLDKKINENTKIMYTVSMEVSYQNA
jgi:hypothetical protein